MQATASGGLSRLVGTGSDSAPADPDVAPADFAMVAAAAAVAAAPDLSVGGMSGLHRRAVVEKKAGRRGKAPRKAEELPRRSCSLASAETLGTNCWSIVWKGRTMGQ